MRLIKVYVKMIFILASMPLIESVSVNNLSNIDRWTESHFSNFGHLPFIL